MKGNITVYLVEDYSLTRVALKCILSEFNNIELIGESDNAYEGISDISKLKPDIVLMDIGLPGMNGLEATKKIKSILQKTKIIMLTSHSRRSEVLAALASGATGYCLKDIRSEVLGNVIKSVFHGAFWLDGTIMNYVVKSFPKPDDTSDLGKFKLIDEKYLLSKRELEILDLLSKGKSNLEIAKELYFSVHTAKAHVSNIIKKLSVKDRVQAAVKAVKENLI